MGCSLSCSPGKRRPYLGVHGGHRALVITDPPKPGRIGWAQTTTGEMTILTRAGVQSFEEWMRTKDFKMIMPPLAPHPGVPFLAGGMPNINLLNKMYNIVPEGQLRARVATQEAGSSLFCSPRQEVPFVVYED